MLGGAVRLLGALFLAYELRGDGALLPHGFRHSMLALELAASDVEAKIILVSSGCTNQPRRLRNALDLDFGFILLYWVSFLLAAGPLSRRSRSWSGACAVGIALFAMAAACLDVREDFGLYGEIDTYVRDTSEDLSSRVAVTETASRIKWGFIFAAALLTAAAAWWPDGNRLVSALLAALFITSAGLGAWGLAAHAAWVELGFTLLVLGVCGLFAIRLLKPWLVTRRWAYAR